MGNSIVAYINQNGRGR